MIIISRAEAKKNNLTHYFTNKPCKRGHVCKRRVSNGVCILCSKLASSLYNKTPKRKQWQRNYGKSRARKEYNKRYVRRPERMEYMREYMREYSKTPKHKEALKKYREGDKYKEYQRKYRAIPENKARALERRLERVLRDPEIKKARTKYLKIWRSSPEGRLRALITSTSRRLRCGNLSKGKRKLLKYTPKEYEAKLITNTTFNSIEEAYLNNYHIDHIVPISYIAKHIENIELQFCVAMDLNNLCLITIEENLFKYNKTDLPIVQKTIEYLWDKYNIQS